MLVKCRQVLAFNAILVGITFCHFYIKSRKGKMIYRNKSPPIDLK